MNKASIGHSEEIVSIKEYVKAYQYALKALIKTLPKNQARVVSKLFMPIGENIIWPCVDGVVILTYQHLWGGIHCLDTKRGHCKVDSFLKVEYSTA